MKKKIMKNIITLIFLILIFSDCDSSYSKVNFIESIKHHLSDTDLEHLTSITFKRAHLKVSHIFFDNMFIPY